MEQIRPAWWGLTLGGRLAAAVTVSALVGLMVTACNDAVMRINAPADQRVDVPGPSGGPSGGASALDRCASDELCEKGGSCCPDGLECAAGACQPPCAGSRCGLEWELCCAPEQICYGLTCTDPGEACALHSDCPLGTVCEPDFGLCLPRQNVGECLYHPPQGEFSPAIECRWAPPPGDVTEGRVDVVMTPVVANLTDDNGDGSTDTFDTPDIVFSSYDLNLDGCCNTAATLRIVSGQCNSGGTMKTHASLVEPAIDNSGGISVGDVNGDGVPEIVAMTIVDVDGKPRVQGTVAFQRQAANGSAWSVLWHNKEYPAWNVHTRGGAQPSLVDLDGVNGPEVLVGNVVLRGIDGTLMWDGTAEAGAGVGIGNNAFLGPVSTAADIDNDGKLEVLAGHSCYDHTGAEKWSFDYSSSNSACAGSLPCDGFTAVGNFDDDAQGEVVIVRQGEVFVLQHTGELLAKIAIPKDDCANNESGPPTVADFDGDGRPEIGTAAADYYSVVDLDCQGDWEAAGCAAEGVLWYVPNQDCSSRVTGSSVFDFDGDGRAEAVYADETSFRIFDGSTGEVLYADNSHGSHTRLEMPVIADVDNDGNAEVVIAENRSKNGTPGIEIWGDAQDNWVFTRRIWNQHSYHVSNITETGSIPSYEQPNWLQEHLNNFRQNVQGEGLFWAPDLVILNVTASCSYESRPSVRVTFDVMNRGSRTVGAGVAVTIYVERYAVDTVRTTRALIPGEREQLAYLWRVPEELAGKSVVIVVAADDVGDGTGENNECEDGGEENNTAEVAGPACEEPA